MVDRRLSWFNRFAPPRFILFVVLMGLTTICWRLVRAAPPGDAFLIGFDIAAIAFMFSLKPLLRDRSAATMRRHAAQNDANQLLVLVLTGLTAIAVLTAISVELPAAKQDHFMAILKLIGTLSLSWVFTNVIYTLHYAHMHYSRAPDGMGDLGGFEFPGTPEPDFGDFLYFAFTASMSFAASDVNVTRRAVRRVVLGHCLLSFVFNIGVLAFAINVLAGAAG